MVLVKLHFDHWNLIQEQRSFGDPLLKCRYLYTKVQGDTFFSWKWPSIIRYIWGGTCSSQHFRLVSYSQNLKTHKLGTLFGVSDSVSDTDLHGIDTSHTHLRVELSALSIFISTQLQLQMKLHSLHLGNRKSKIDAIAFCFAVDSKFLSAATRFA